VASQFHPEFKSRPEKPHPLFAGFVAAAIAHVGAPAAVTIEADGRRARVPGSVEIAEEA
jgi:CTP synthase